VTPPADATVADRTATPDPPAPAWPRRVWARWRAIPVLVRAATVALAGLMAAMAYLYPVNYGFDEPQHFDMAYVYAHGEGPFAPGNLVLSAGVYKESHTFARGFPPRKRLADNPIAARDKRLSLGAYGGADPAARRVPNQMTQHPPLYYLLGAAIIDIPGVSSLAYDMQFTLLRWLSLLLLLPIPWLCFAAARRLGAGELAPAAALMPLLLPAFARTGGSVTNDSLLILASSVVLYLLTKVVTGDSSIRTAVLVSVGILVALLTKGFGLILPLLAFFAYLVCWRRAGAGVLRSMIIVAIGSAVGGIWWLHNIVAYGEIQPNGRGPGYPDDTYGPIYRAIHPDGGQGHLRPFLKDFAQSLVERFWGSIGLIEAPGFNSVFTWVATVIASILVLIALGHGIGGRWGRIALAVPLLMAPLTVVLLLSESWPLYHRFILLAGVQGRYLFAGIVPLSAAVAFGLSIVVRGRAARMVPVVLVACAIFAEAWAARAVINAWWITTKPVSTFVAWKNVLHSVVDWAPWPIGMTIVIFALILAAFIRLCYVAVQLAIRPESVPEPAEPVAA
jgi:hypothetical protein